MKREREHAKLNNKKGFTLAELLVVVAILAVLVAISIPIFTGRLDAAKKATRDANKRSLKAHIGVTVMQEADPSSANLQALLAKYVAEDNAKCPDGGVYKI